MRTTGRRATESSRALARAVVWLGGLLPHSAAAQADLPVLEAKARTVDIQDGDVLLEGIWMIEPAVAFEVYHARRTSSAKRVTFITDVDSMSFDVQPGRTYDFVILLDGKDACRTQISTMRQGCRRAESSGATGPAVLPITIREGKLQCRGKINDSEELALIFDTGASTNVLYPSAMEKGAKLEFDGVVSNSGTGGATLRQTSSDNRIAVAGLRWEHEPVLYIEKQFDGADGVLGYPVFENKVIEIDYDRMLMSVHDELPALAAGFAKAELSLLDSLTQIEVTLVNGENAASGLFTLDTGANGALWVNQAFAATNRLHGALRKLGTSESRGVGSGVIRNEIVLLPGLTIAGFTLRDLPIDVEVSYGGDGDDTGGVLCMDVLRRFNTILDYPRHKAYLRPSARFDAPF